MKKKQVREFTGKKDMFGRKIYTGDFVAVWWGVDCVPNAGARSNIAIFRITIDEEDAQNPYHLGQLCNLWTGRDVCIITVDGFDGDELDLYIPEAACKRLFFG